MSHRNVITIEPHIGRRREARLRVLLAVRLVSRDGTGRAVLADLSQHGARLTGVDDLLRPGQEALLRWDRHEAFGLVVWSANEQCGMCFYDPIPQAALIETRAINDGDRLRSEHDGVREAARSFVLGQRRI